MDETKINKQTGFSCPCEKCYFVARKTAKKPRSEMMSKLQEINRDFKKKFNFGYQMQVIGSAKTNAIYAKKKTFFDTDINLIIQGKKCDELMANTTEMQKIKPFIQERLKQYAADSNKQSHTPITIRNFGDEAGNFDIAVWYKDLKNPDYYQKLVGKKPNKYTQNQTPEKNPQCKKEFIRKNINYIKQQYLNLKCKNSIDKKNFKPSISL